MHEKPCATSELLSALLVVESVSQDDPTDRLSLTTPTDRRVRVGNETLEEFPDDVHIPDDALVVLLESFEGPLDLLLYLIRKRNLDVLKINLAEIADQYVKYIDLMSTFRLQLAGEYLVIASTLMAIKSRALLPQLEGDEEDEEDPAAELRRRLIEYERVKLASEQLNELPRLERDAIDFQLPLAKAIAEEARPTIDLDELAMVFSEIMDRAKLYQQHRVFRATISVRERMVTIMEKLNRSRRDTPFEELFNVEEGKISVVASFLAVLELVRTRLIWIHQSKPFEPISIRLRELVEGG